MKSIWYREMNEWGMGGERVSEKNGYECERGGWKYINGERTGIWAC